MNLENEKIRKTALDLFNSKGLENSTLDEIYALANVDKSSLQKIYLTKKSLISEIYTLGKNDMFKFMYGEVLEIENYHDLMRKVFYQAVIWALSNRELFRFMNLVQAHPYSWTEASDEKIYPSVNEKIMARTAGAIEKGIIKDFPIDFAVHFMTGMQTSCVSYILSLKAVTEEEYQDLMEPMFQACWDAFKK
jgi:AcrR family transcriptional regulator